MVKSNSRLQVLKCMSRGCKAGSDNAAVNTCALQVSDHVNQPDSGNWNTIVPSKRHNPILHS